MDYRDKIFLLNKMLQYGLDTYESVLELSEESTGEKYTTIIEMLESKHNSFLLSKSYNRKNSAVNGTHGTVSNSIFDGINVYDNKENKINISSYKNIITTDNNVDILFLPYLNKNIYAGFLLERDSNILKKYKALYSALYTSLVMKFFNDYEMITEEYRRLNKEMCLIIRKK